MYTIGAIKVVSSKRDRGINNEDNVGWMILMMRVKMDNDQGCT